MKKTSKLITALILLSFNFEPLVAAPADNQAALLKQLQLLNQVPEDQLNEKTDPGFSILRSIYDIDGPDFLTLRRLIGMDTVRARLNPSARCVLAGILSQRWDTFVLSGNLWLAGLKSPNPELRNKARQRLVDFIEPAHIPELIDILRIPGPNAPAYEILQEVTGKSFEPNVKVWRRWWVKEHRHVDVVGYLLKNTRAQLAAHEVTPFNEEKFWYLPETINDAHVPYDKRSSKEQSTITVWNEWAGQDVKRFLDQWAISKPVLDRITHQPDPRVNKFLEKLVNDPGYGDYASVVLAWRSSRASLPVIQSAFEQQPTVGRALALGSLGDKNALQDLLKIIGRHRAQPLSFNIMDDNVRFYVQTLHTVVVIPAEQAFELLTHHVFGFDAAVNRSQKKKAVQAAERWLKDHEDQLTFDKRREYFTLPGRS